jgi:hypothetical protein
MSRKMIDNARNLVLGAGFFSESRSCGVVAQLGERLNGIQEAASSILASSTKNIKGLTKIVSPFFFGCFT